MNGCQLEWLQSSDLCSFGKKKLTRRENIIGRVLNAADNLATIGMQHEFLVYAAFYIFITVGIIKIKFGGI